MTQRLTTLPLAMCLGLFAALGGPRPASAYCIIPDAGSYWGLLPAAHEIPVYVAVGPHTSVTNTGLSVAEVERLTREIISRHNEASSGPELVYMGLTTGDMNYAPSPMQIANAGSLKSAQFAMRPPGITVDSYTCEYEEDHQPCGDSPNLRACTDAGGAPPHARISIVPVGCANDIPEHTLESNDLGTVLLHEFGHALGLAHSDISQAECEAKVGRVHGNALAGNDGVMRATLGANFPALREWRRDDIEGLASLYGPPPPMELVYWDDQLFPAAPANHQLTSLVGASVHRPPAVSSATPSGAELYLATTEHSRVVLHALGAAGLISSETIDPSPAGRTWANPGLALGDAHLFVVWAANELPHDNHINLRWALRSLDQQAWTLHQVDPPSRVKRLAAGYAPGVDLFLVATLTEYESDPALLLIDSQGQLLTTHELPGPRAFDIGGPACFQEDFLTRCVVPYSTNSFAGPKLGWLDLELDPDGGLWLVDDTAGPVDATGKLGLASRPDSARFRGFAGARRYELEQLAGVGAVDLPDPLPPPTLAAQTWPIALGSSFSQRSATRWWAFARHRIECGNGIIQGPEQCDDGDLEPGDGCSPACLLEEQSGLDLDPETDPEAETGTGTGGYSLDDEDDCDCRSTPRSPLGPALLLLVLATLRRRSRRRPRPPEPRSRPRRPRAPSPPASACRSRAR